MRGAPADIPSKQVYTGLIPAHAGSTAEEDQLLNGDGAHPRACGEHCSVASSVFVSVGSSPRMRGARHGCSGGDKLTGLIPAHAGSTELRR